MLKQNSLLSGSHREALLKQRSSLSSLSSFGNSFTFSSNPNTSNSQTILLKQFNNALSELVSISDKLTKSLETK